VRLLHYICSLFDSVFYCTKRKKGLGLVNCELYSAELIRLVVPSFPNNIIKCLDVVVVDKINTHMFPIARQRVDNSLDLFINHLKNNII